jgi:GNAT superfamily N-acetyltransferase
MSKEQNPISLSVLDENRFCIKTAKAPWMKIEDITYVLEFCKENQVELLIARCPTVDLTVVHEMEHLGFSLMDTLTYYVCKLKKNKTFDRTPGMNVRPIIKGEELIVKSIAAESFRGYMGHYHADKRLDPQKCDDVYTDWAYQACLSRNETNEVLLVENEGVICGFATMSKKNIDEGEGVLFGVSPSFQGKGVYNLLMKGGIEWCIAQGLDKMLVSTQIINVAVQKVWIRLGFEPIQSYYTFHKWFSEHENSNIKSP